jgi:hypothetical protein
MPLQMVHDETLAVECPDIAFCTGFAFRIPALIRILDSCDGTIRSIHTLHQGTACRDKPAFTDWTEHLSSPLKVRKIVLIKFIIA